MQKPPLYSAIHIDGKRAHVLARSGEIVEPEPRPVNIYKLSLLSYSPPFCEIEVYCSKGTYIRSLARDLALGAGSRGSLVSLCRTAVGGFSLEDAFNPLSSDDPAKGLKEALRPVDHKAIKALGLSCCNVDDKTARDMIHGKPLINMNIPPSKVMGVFNETGGFVGIIEHKNNSWHYGYIYASV